MSKKYRREKIIKIDLNDRENINIIQSDKTIISDYDTEIFRQELNKRTEEAEEFHRYIIEKELESNRKISDEELDTIMKNLLKQNKILKYLLKEQEN